MDSESDWDSIAGEGPDLGDVSVSMAADSSRHQKHTPRPPSIEKKPMSPVINKVPLHKTSNDFRNPPRVAEQYRNMSNKERPQNQGITTFKDRGEITLEREDTVPSRKSTPASLDQRDFHEIEMKENTRQFNMFQANTNRKTSQLKDSNENLPYTEFEASDMSPRKNDPTPKNQITKKAHQEYITRSPAPETLDRKPQRKSFKNEPKLRQPTTENRTPKASKKTKKNSKFQNSKIKKESIISNQNADGYYDSGDTDGDVTWSEHHPEVKNIHMAPTHEIVLKSSDQIMLEERFEYENAVRNYHSIYIQNQARMPVIADKVETLSRRGIQEFFGALQIIIDFIIIFTVETIRFILRQFGRKLIGGTVTAFGDFLTKPVFSALFNSIIQPSFVLIWNIMHGIRKLLEPILILSRELLSQVAVVLSAFRLVEVNWKKDSHIQSV